MAKTDFFKTFVDDLGDPGTAIAADGTASSEFSGYIDTGSYVLNAALSGSIFGGLPNNKAIVFGGDPATGKTFFALGLVKQWQKQYADGRTFYFDTESAVTNKMMTDRGIDIGRVAKSPTRSGLSFYAPVAQGNGGRSGREGHKGYDKARHHQGHIPSYPFEACQGAGSVHHYQSRLRTDWRLHADQDDGGRQRRSIRIRYYRDAI